MLVALIVLSFRYLLVSNHIRDDEMTSFDVNIRDINSSKVFHSMLLISGANWDVSSELGFRLYGVASISEEWEPRAFIDKTSFSLTLNNLKETDAGTYFCKVFDATDERLFERSLIVEGLLHNLLLLRYPEAKLQIICLARVSFSVVGCRAER